VSERRCRMGFGVAGNYWWQGQNAFSEKQIGELLTFVGQGTGADEWAGFCFVFSSLFFFSFFSFFLLPFLGSVFFGLAVILFWGIKFLGARRTIFAAAGIYVHSPEV
jgi:hypothetical protein